MKVPTFVFLFTFAALFVLYSNMPVWGSISDAGAAAQDRDALYKEYEELRHMHSQALVQAIEQVNARNLGELEELKKRPASKDEIFIKQLGRALDAVKRGQAFEAEAPPKNRRHKGESFPEYKKSFWLIKISRDNALRVATKHTFEPFRYSYISLLDRAAKARELKLAKEIKAVLETSQHGPQGMAKTRQPILLLDFVGTWNNGDEYFTLQEKNGELRMHYWNSSKTAKTEESVTRRDKDRIFVGWEMRLSAGGQQLIQTDGGHIGKIWVRVSSG